MYKATLPENKTNIAVGRLVSFWVLAYFQGLWLLVFRENVSWPPFLQRSFVRWKFRALSETKGNWVHPFLRCAWKWSPICRTWTTYLYGGDGHPFIKYRQDIPVCVAPFMIWRTSGFLFGWWPPFPVTVTGSIIPRKLQHTRRAHPRQSPWPTMKGIPL